MYLLHFDCFENFKEVCMRLANFKGFEVFVDVWEDTIEKHYWVLYNNRNVKLENDIWAEFDLWPEYIYQQISDDKSVIQYYNNLKNTRLITHKELFESILEFNKKPDKDKDDDDFITELVHEILQFYS